MTKVYLEHANITVNSLEDTQKFLLTAFPEWSVRGGGKSNWFGKPIEWMHIGDDDFYISARNGGEGPQPPNWKDNGFGLNHLCFVVDDLELVQGRLENGGFAMDHAGENNKHRRAAYYIDNNNIQYEFLQYFTTGPEKNEYF